MAAGFGAVDHAHSGNEDIGLAALEKREANLRAKIAERELVRSRFEMLERLAVTADLREDASGEHGYRVARLAALLAEEIGWKPEACEALDLAARLHDIGKVGVPDRILLESAALKEAERKVMSSHTVIGSELLSKSNVAEIRLAEEIARCHHEWWDGTGYPARLKGKRIPAGARITALADVFDAMTHGRPYEQAWPVDVALEKIAALSGTQFDPDMAERFIPLVKRLCEQQEDLDAYLGRAAKSSPFLQARSRIRQMLTQGRLQDASSGPDPASTLH
jgi:putative two-component system response regulator